MSRCRSRRIRTTRPSGLIRFAISPAVVIFTVCALCALLTRSSSAQPPRTAVMDLRAGEHVTAQEARTLTGMLRTALHETGAFTLINREDMEEIAKNHEIELLFCDDDACMLKVGSLLGAQKLVAGEVGLVLGEFIVNARLVDIAGNALANERVASQRSAPTVAALQEAMGELAATLAGRPMPVRVAGESEDRAKYDGLIYSIEGDRVLIDRGKSHGVQRGTVYDVFASPGGSSDSLREAGDGPRPKRLGRIEIVEVHGTYSAARWQGGRTGLQDPPGSRIRKFRVPSCLSVETQVAYHWPIERVDIDFGQPYYQGDVLSGVISHKFRVAIVLPSYGASVMLTPRGRFSLGLRASMIPGDAVHGYYVYDSLGGVSSSYPEILKPVQSMYRLGAAVRMRLRASRKMDIDLESGLDRVFWDLGLLDRDGTRPPWGVADVRAGVRFYIFDRWGISCYQGACASIGGDWRVSSVMTGIGLFRRF